MSGAGRCAAVGLRTYGANPTYTLAVSIYTANVPSVVAAVTTSTSCIALKIKDRFMISIMNHAQTLTSILLRNPESMRILSMVKSLNLPDCWIGAGFVRNAVWDALRACASAPKVGGDVDVIWFDPENSGSGIDEQLAQQLGGLDSSIRWSVKNQSRMHTRNGDAPYQSTMDAMKYWPETATAVAVRMNAAANIDISAPYGLDDLFEGVVRPTPRFMTEKRAIFERRWKDKGWQEKWPFLRIVAA